MAGMLPGVESARRRRFHGGSLDSSVPGTRRSSFCLYTTGHEAHFAAKSGRSGLIHGGALGNIAREAKERLDERFRSRRALEIKRNNSTGSMRPGKNGEGGEALSMDSSMMIGNVQREVFCSKRPKFIWSKMGWRSAEQAECAVCLDEFKTGDILVHLPCAHRFHWDCVVPWLESTSHCPCCRMTTFSS